MKLIKNPTAKQIASITTLMDDDQNSPFARLFDQPYPIKQDCILLELNNSLIGFSIINSCEDTAEIYRLYIAPQYRRSGLGFCFSKKLLESIFSEGFISVMIEWIDETSLTFWKSVVGDDYEVDDIEGQQKFYIRLPEPTDEPTHYF